MENYFSRTMTSKSDAELLDIANSTEGYSSDAVSAAKWEIERRATILIEQVKQQLDEGKEAITQPAKEVAPRVYSELVLIIFGILFSVVASGILVAINLVQINKRLKAVFAVVFSLLFILVQSIALKMVNLSFSVFMTIPTSIIGVLLLQRIIWDREYPREKPIQKRSPWVALLIGVAISILVTVLFYKNLIELQGLTTK